MQMSNQKLPLQQRLRPRELSVPMQGGIRRAQTRMCHHRPVNAPVGWRNLQLSVQTASLRGRTLSRRRVVWLQTRRVHLLSRGRARLSCRGERALLAAVDRRHQIHRADLRRALSHHSDDFRLFANQSATQRILAFRYIILQSQHTFRPGAPWARRLYR